MNRQNVITFWLKQHFLIWKSVSFKVFVNSLVTKTYLAFLKKIINKGLVLA